MTVTSHFGSVITASRYHDFSAGHRVMGHEGKCRCLHGHNYRVYFEVVATELDSIGRVLDFSVINTKLCQWLETNWDHKMLLWEKDPLYRFFIYSDELEDEVASLVPVPFNPTAEEMARFLLRTIGPLQLEGTGAVLTSVTVWETRKCYATATLNWNPPVTYTTEDTMEYKAGQGDADGEIPF